MADVEQQLITSADHFSDATNHLVERVSQHSELVARATGQDDVELSRAQPGDAVAQHPQWPEQSLEHYEGGEDHRSHNEHEDDQERDMGLVHSPAEVPGEQVGARIWRRRHIVALAQAPATRFRYSPLLDIFDTRQVTGCRPAAIWSFVAHLQVQARAKALGCLEIRRTGREGTHVFLDEATYHCVKARAHDQPEKNAH